MTPNIFISFASQDLKIAMTICKALESRGFDCWISARNILPGENFQVAIVQAIRRAKIMLLVFTANSNHSEEITKELALASQQKLIVIPLRVEDVAPNDAFAYEFATRQWIDLFIDWEIAMDQLSQRIANALADRAAVAAPPPPASVAEALAQIEAAAPAAPAAAKPVTAPTPARKPAPEPAAETDADVQTPGQGRRLGLIAAGLALVAIVAGLAIPALLKPKAEASSGPKPMLAVAVAQPVADSAPPPAVVEPVADSAASAEVKSEVKPKRKARKVVAAAPEEIPY